MTSVRLRPPLITANQVTMARMVLLPIPCALLLYGSHAQQLWSVLLYTLLGVTDFVDGRMARRYGPTVLGGLLDPVADKVFMAAVIMPLSAFKMVAPGVILAILLREFIITSLRSAMSLRGQSVKTSVLAKLKTAIQMVAAGFVFIIYKIPDTTTVLTLLGILSLGAAAVLVWRKLAVGKLSALVSVPCGLIMLAFAVRASLEVEDAVNAHWGVILVFTWGSALEYLMGAGALLEPGERIHGMGRLLWSLVAGLVLPYVMVQLPEITPIWVLLLGAELSSGAVDNLRCHEGPPPRRFIYPVRSAVLAGGAALVMALPATGQPGSPAFWGALGLALVMSAWTALDFYSARKIIWGENAVSPQKAQSSVGR